MHGLPAHPSPMPSKVLFIAALSALVAVGADAQVANNKVLAVPTCARFPAPLTQVTDPAFIGIPGLILDDVFIATPRTFPTVAQFGTDTLTVGPLFAGTCANPVANPAGRIGVLTSKCNANTYAPIVVNLGEQLVDPTLSNLQATCAASAVTATANVAAAVNRVCRGDLAVVGNTPQSKFPGSTQPYDYTPTVTYTAIGGFQNQLFTAGAGTLTRRVCVLWPNVTVTGKPASGTGKLAKNVVGSVSVGTVATNAPAAANAWLPGTGAPAWPTAADLLAGPLRQATFAETVTLNYRKPYLNWNQL